MRNNKNDYIYEGSILVGVGFFLMLILFGAFGEGGKAVSNFFIGIFGYAIYAVAVISFIVGVLKFFKFTIQAKPLRIVGCVLIVISLILISQIATSGAHMGNYGKYLSGCFNGADTVGGALFGLIAFPLMAINYYFAIVFGVLLFIASIVTAFFVEIRGKAIYRSIIKGKGKSSKLINTSEEIDVNQNMMNADVLTDINSEPVYTPLSNIGDLTGADNESMNKTNNFVAPKSNVTDENYGSVRVISDRERAARVLYGDIQANALAESEEPQEEPVQERHYSAVDVLYGKVPIESVSNTAEKATVELDGNYQSYTNSERKRIIKEKLAREQAEKQGLRPNDNTNNLNNSAPSTPYSGTQYSNVVNSTPSANNMANNVAPTNYSNTNNSEVTNYGNANNGMSQAYSATEHDRSNNSDQTNSVRVSNNINNVDTSAPNDRKSSFGYGGNIAEKTTFDNAQRADNQVANSATATDKAINDEQKRLQDYKEMLLQKRKERSDKGGVHQAPVKSVLGGEVGTAVEHNAGASKVLGENGFVNTVTKIDPNFSRHNIANAPDAMIEPEIVKPKLRPYKAPPVAILKEYNDNPGVNDDIQEKIETLENTLSSFNINAKVINVVTGPAFTRLELQMPVGVSVNKISGLSNDIAMCLEAKSVRCQIPIPGKNLFGVEIPNKKRGIVGFKKLLCSPEFNTNKHALSFAVGMDCDGNSCVVDLNKMPHLLIAGSTGSGKSVCINTLICSLLFKYSPEDVKIALVDPKQVELSNYNGLPHLLVSKAICDNDKVANLLDWTIDEMEHRYTLMNERRVKNIAQYNETIDTSVEETLPYIVVIVDEVADIVISLKREFEERIMRLAQKARAAGIILVLATQRPSVDVITGSIKANLPSRIAFAVTNFADSKTIIDAAGAEKLLGYGDMLFSQSTSPDLMRLQGAFIDTVEVNAVCDFIRENNDCWFDPRIEAAIFKKVSANNSETNLQDANGEELDMLFVKAVWNVIESGMASASRLQRTLGIGFPKASRYVDMMENMGYIGKNQGGNKPRDVMITREQFLEIYGDVELY